MDIYGVIDEYLAENRTGALATIVKRTGATPQGAGAKVFIGDDGRIFGTVGGGCVEAEVWQQARRITGSRETRVIHYAMNGTEIADEGMICGGSVDIFLEPLQIEHRPLYRQLRSCMNNGTKALLLTSLGTGPFTKTIFSEDGELWGDPVDGLTVETLQDRFADRAPSIVKGMVIEPVNSVTRLSSTGEATSHSS